MVGAGDESALDVSRVSVEVLLPITRRVKNRSAGSTEFTASFSLNQGAATLTSTFRD